MKQELNIEAIHAPGDSLLAQVALVLQRSVVSPPCLVWSTIPESREARIWVTIAETGNDFPEMLAELERVPGVTRVQLLRPLQAPPGNLGARGPASLPVRTD